MTTHPPPIIVSDRWLPAELGGVDEYTFRRYRAGFIFGLCGHPFWIYGTFTSGQWGMFVVSLWFTGNHIRGLINYKKGQVNGKEKVGSDFN